MVADSKIGKKIGPQKKKYLNLKEHMKFLVFLMIMTGLFYQQKRIK